MAAEFEKPRIRWGSYAAPAIGLVIIVIIIVLIVSLARGRGGQDQAEIIGGVETTQEEKVSSTTLPSAELTLGAPNQEGDTEVEDSAEEAPTKGGEIKELPVTGFPAAAVAVISALFVGIGFRLRRSSK